MEEITVFGAGSWGTALANLLGELGHRVVLWCRRSDQARAINLLGENPNYLRGYRISSNVMATSKIDEAVESPKWVLALPTQAVRGFLTELSGNMAPQRHEICNVAKGIEIDSAFTVSEIVKNVLGDVSYSVLSGPSHAEEVIRGFPTAVVVASLKVEAAEMWQNVFSRPTFRVYTSNDVVGVEIGGAVKNVIAIAAGIAKAMKLGDNALAALVSRGLAEIMRLGAKLGANPLTLSGLAGVGDLIVTCFSGHSRNMRLGFAIGMGKSMKEASDELGQVAEGIYTVKALKKMAQQVGVELPIVEEVYAILYEGLSPNEALSNLLLRDPKPELPPAMQWM